MYTTLLELPLFQGLSVDTLTGIVETAELDFDVIASGNELWHEGDTCTGLTFIISGRMASTTPSADGTWHVTEELSAPAMVGLDVLYGTRRTHRHTFTALERSRVMHVDKKTVGEIIKHVEVFRLNVLNTLTTQVVRTNAPLWLPADATTEGRIVAFMHAHVQHPAGHKIFSISRATLGDYLGEDPRYISRALNTLEARKLIRTLRRNIDVPAFEDLLRNYRE